MKNTILHILCLLFFSYATHGQAKQDKLIEKKLDDLLSSAFQSSGPGCAILVARKGEIAYKKAFGTANLELLVPVKPEMVFNLASITKQFTAVAILQLVEQNKISLQDSIQQFLPDYPWKGHTIRIDNLLSHTSGIKDYLQINYSGLFMEKWDFSPRQLIDSFKSHPLEFEPGTRFSYSNSGYFILGAIIEKVSGKSYQDYIQEYLLQPAGMTNSFFDRSGSIIPNRVSGYLPENGVYQNAPYWSPAIQYSAGGLISNVTDLFKWHQALNTYRLIKRESLQKAQSNSYLKNGSPTGYGFGWYLATSNEIKSIAHQGALPGFQTKEIYYPDEDVFIVILSNNGKVNIEGLSIQVSGIVLNKSLQPEIKIADNILDQYLGVYRSADNKKRTLRILKMNGTMVAKFSDQEIIPLLFQSDNKFQFKNLLNAQCEFIFENGKVTKFIANQNGVYEWIKEE